MFSILWTVPDRYLWPPKQMKITSPNQQQTPGIHLTGGMLPFEAWLVVGACVALLGPDRPSERAQMGFSHERR